MHNGAKCWINSEICHNGQICQMHHFAMMVNRLVTTKKNSKLKPKLQISCFSILPWNESLTPIEIEQTLHSNTPITPKNAAQNYVKRWIKSEICHNGQICQMHNFLSLQ